MELCRYARKIGQIDAIEIVGDNYLCSKNGECCKKFTIQSLEVEIDICQNPFLYKNNKNSGNGIDSLFKGKSRKMAESLDQIIKFLDLVKDFNPIHRDSEKAYELASLIKKYNNDFEVKREQIVPGLYLASRLLCMNEHIFDVRCAEFEFKRPVYLSSSTFIDEGTMLYADEALAVKGGFYKQNEGKDVQAKELKDCKDETTAIDKTKLEQFGESIGIRVYTSHDEKRVLKALAGSLISGALWKCAENMKERGFGLYNKQIWRFHKTPEYGIFVANAWLKRAREPFYFFDTMVKQEHGVVVSGEAVCIFLKKQ